MGANGSLYALIENSSISRENVYLSRVSHDLSNGLCIPTSANLPNAMMMKTVFRRRKIISNPIKPLRPNLLPYR